MPPIYALREQPRTSITSNCGSNIIVTLGPYIYMPMPIVPNIFFPFQYLYQANVKAKIEVQIAQPVDDDHVYSINLSGEYPIEKIKSYKEEHDEHIFHESLFSVEKSCSEMEGSVILIEMRNEHDTLEQRRVNFKTSYVLFVEGP
ncbi:MAG: hypothetical protein FJ119_11180 [Deltaproteobacteria bacterium]|nr:hypothetical protein [Deltaproteobacteria bacterium]